MEHLPELACPRKEENERLPPPIPGEEASIGSGQKDNCAGAGSEDNLRGVAKGIECDMGGGSQRLTFMDV